LNRLNEEKSKKLGDAKVIWLATASDNKVPHLVPIWFVVHEEKIYCCTGKKSVKIRNIQNNPQIAFSLEEGSNPIIGQGSAEIIYSSYPVEIVEKFKTKYDWDIRDDDTYDCLLEISPAKWLMN
jgi:general stress protein 26